MPLLNDPREILRVLLRSRITVANRNVLVAMAVEMKMQHPASLEYSLFALDVSAFAFLASLTLGKPGMLKLMVLRDVF